jgi:hypothetical protein
MVENKVYVIGVGMSKFIKPRGEVDYPGNNKIVNNYCKKKKKTNNMSRIWS